MAQAILDEVTLEQQVQGLACNTEEVSIAPDASGNVTVADNVLHVEVLNIPEKFIVTRGSAPTLLYNVTDNTDVFTETEIDLRLVYGLTFDELPFAQQVSVADEAGRRYQMLVVGDAGADRMLEQMFMQSRMKARAADIRVRKVNIFQNWSSMLPYWGAKRTNRRWMR